MSLNFKSAILHAFFPERCPFCGKVMPYTQSYCDSCGKKVKKLSPMVCAACKQYNCICESKNHNFSHLISVFSYEDLVRRAVLNMKFYNHPSYAATFGKLMAEHIKLLLSIQNIDLIIPVPMTANKLKSRGYNQADLLAKVISHELGIKLFENILYKSQDTLEQHTLSAKARQTNLLDAYNVHHSRPLHDKVVLLVDDVFTTGSTADECARVLRASGARKVMVATICKVINAPPDDNDEPTSC